MHRLCLLALMFVCAAVTAAPAKTNDAAFARQFGDSFFDEYWKLYPDGGISSGYYKYADRLVVPDERARAHARQQLERWQSQLRRFAPESLSPIVRADWTLLSNDFESDLWSLVEYKSWEWNPAGYNVADPFAKVLAADYAPLEQRLRTVGKRLEKVPAYYAAAKTNIRNPSREHTQLAIEQNRGALSVFGDSLQKQIDGSKLSAAEKAGLTRQAATARAAIEEYIGWLQALEKQLANGNARSFRIGRENYEKRFQYSIQSGDTAEALYTQALAEKERLLARMTLLTDMLWPKYFRNVAPPEDRLDRIGRLIAELSKQHVAPENFFTEIKRQIPELEKWVADHDLLTLDPSKPLQVRETPPYQRGVARASVDAPGPYDAGGTTFYNVTPLDDLTPERAESFLREYNRWMLPVLNIHEAVPGHYLQLVYANKSPSLIKSLFGNGAMIEGWAVYSERMMLESGYGDHTAEAWLIYSKWNLRSVCNTILDYSVHVLNMSEQDALTLLTRDAFQSAEEAKGKWRRVQVTSVQLTSYFAGYSAIYSLRERLKREQGEAFDLKRFHEQFLSYGSAPVALISRLMTGQP